MGVRSRKDPAFLTHWGRLSLVSLGNSLFLEEPQAYNHEMGKSYAPRKLKWSHLKEVLNVVIVAY